MHLSPWLDNCLGDEITTQNYDTKGMDVPFPLSVSCGHTQHDIPIQFLVQLTIAVLLSS